MGMARIDDAEHQIRYAKKKVVDKVVEMGFRFISKLCSEADTKYLYQREHERCKGAKKKYDEKVV